MQNRRMLVFLVPIILIMTVGGAYIHANAQTAVTVDINSLTAQTVVILIVIGIGAATLQAYQGWSASGEKFIPKAFVDRILAGALHAIWISITTALSYTTLSPIVYVLVFGAAVGFTEMSLKLASSVQKPDPVPTPQPAGSPSGKPEIA